MLIADISPDGTMVTMRDEHAIARLGKGVDERRKITSETFERVLKLLTEYKNISDKHHSERIIACGTSALRDAANRDEFIAFVEGQLGFTIEVLSGDQEAELTYRGAVSEFLSPGMEQGFGVLDIGGGSTELTTGVGMKIRDKLSLDIGSVRLTERFLKNSPPSSLSMNHALNEIRSKVKQFSSLPTQTTLIGVAGTLTTLAAMNLQLSEYDRNRVSGHKLSLDAIQQIFNLLRIKTVDEILTFPQILPGRADIILAGILILMEVMKRLNMEYIVASDRGLRYGIALREAADKKIN